MAFMWTDAFVQFFVVFPCLLLTASFLLLYSLCTNRTGAQLSLYCQFLNKSVFTNLTNIQLCLSMTVHKKIVLPKIPPLRNRNRFSKTRSHKCFLTLWKFAHLLTVHFFVYILYFLYYRSVEQNWKLRNKPMCLWSINLWWRRQEYTTEK